MPDFFNLQRRIHAADFVLQLHPRELVHDIAQLNGVMFDGIDDAGKNQGKIHLERSLGRVVILDMP